MMAEKSRSAILVTGIALIALSTASCGNESKTQDNADGNGRQAPAPSTEQPTNGMALEPLQVNPLDLPDKFRGLLRSEMQQIQAGMQQLLPLIVQRQADEGAAIAEQIHESFILKQSLSQSELKELIQMLPKGFVKLDQSFHKTSKALSEALRKKELQEGVALYGKMVAACLECHERYAESRFPRQSESESESESERERERE